MRGGKEYRGRDVPFGDIKQASVDQAFTTVKMLWTDSVVKCCHPELQGAEGHLGTLGEGSMENVSWTVPLG